MFYFNPNPDNSIKKPVVIALHGCGQSAENFNKITDWTKLATEENFILIFPQQKTSNNIKTVGRLLLPTENQVHILSIMWPLWMASQNYYRLSPMSMTL